MANDFTWHKVSEEEREEIKKKAKKIMDSFSSKLEGIPLDKESLIVRGSGVREDEKNYDEISREIMFSNAKQKSSDFILAEKKKWN
jgi:Asp-tRNA(Asn)/Glu-tRNA(Gln) amidotransferase C subunit